MINRFRRKLIKRLRRYDIKTEYFKMKFMQKVLKKRYYDCLVDKIKEEDRVKCVPDVKMVGIIYILYCN